MSENNSFFFDEWRDCLHAHFLYVVETQDTVTEPTLRHVLHDAGVDEELVESWYREALGHTAEMVENATDVLPPSETIDAHEPLTDMQALELEPLIEPSESEAEISLEDVAVDGNDTGVEEEQALALEDMERDDAETAETPDQELWNPTLFDF